MDCTTGRLRRARALPHTSSITTEQPYVSSRSTPQPSICWYRYVAQRRTAGIGAAAASATSRCVPLQRTHRRRPASRKCGFVRSMQAASSSVSVLAFQNCTFCPTAPAASSISCCWLGAVGLSGNSGRRADRFRPWQQILNSRSRSSFDHCVEVADPATLPLAG